MYTQIQKNLLKITYNKSIMKENHVKLCKDYMVLFLVGRKCSMALIKCPECGKEVSDKAKICPNCGVDIMENAPNIEPIKKKKRLKYVGLAIILLCLGGLGYWGIKIVPEKQAERDKEIYNEIVKNIEDCKFKTATDIIEEGLSKDNKNKVVLYIKNIIKDTQINSINDVSLEKLYLYEVYLKILESIDIDDSTTKELVCDYLNKAVKLESYSEYFSIIKYYKSSDYTVRSKVPETAMGNGEVNAGMLQAGIKRLDSIDMSKYSCEGYGISEIEAANDKERKCYELLKYAYGDMSINPTETLGRLEEAIMSYTEPILKAVTILSDEVQPIIDSLPVL